MSYPLVDKYTDQSKEMDLNHNPSINLPPTVRAASPASGGRQAPKSTAAIADQRPSVAPEARRASWGSNAHLPPPVVTPCGKQVSVPHTASAAEFCGSGPSRTGTPEKHAKANSTRIAGELPEDEKLLRPQAHIS